MDSQYRFDDGPNKPATSLLFGPELLASSFYQLSPPEVKKVKALVQFLHTLVYNIFHDLTLKSDLTVKKYWCWPEAVVFYIFRLFI